MAASSVPSGHATRHVRALLADGPSAFPWPRRWHQGAAMGLPLTDPTRQPPAGEDREVHANDDRCDEQHPYRNEYTDMGSDRPGGLHHQPRPDREWQDDEHRGDQARCVAAGQQRLAQVPEAVHAETDQDDLMDDRAGVGTRGYSRRSRSTLREPQPGIVSHSSPSCTTNATNIPQVANASRVISSLLSGELIRPDGLSQVVLPLTVR